MKYAFFRIALTMEEILVVTVLLGGKLKPLFIVNALKNAKLNCYNMGQRCLDA
jgi:hypothetical protein